MLFSGETAQSYYEEGLTAAMKGDVPLAANRFRRALELDTQLHNARYQLGKCCLRMGQAGEALELMQAAVRFMPGFAPPLIDAGYALLLLGRTDDARRNFSDALQINSKDPRAILGLARCAAVREQWATVVNLVQHTLELGHATFDAHYLLARSADKCDMPEVAAENYNKAIELIDKSIDASPDSATGYFLRGNTYYHQGNYNAALSDFNTALEKVKRDAHYAAYHEHFTFLDILDMKGLSQQQLQRDEQSRETARARSQIEFGNEQGASSKPDDNGKGSV